MQIGTKIWAIDPCEQFISGKCILTVGKAYEVMRVSGNSFKILIDLGNSRNEHWFPKSAFNKYFSLTPPKEKELKMELNYLKVLLPVVKEDLQTSYGIVGHESTAINRFVSKVEELINSQS